MTTSLQALLADHDVLLADGAMGTGLFALGLETGASPELWNIEQPGRVMAVHRSFVAAGADILLTNSFGANRFRLALHDAADRVRELNAAAVAVAREAASAADRPVLIAGSMGPTGEILEPLGLRSCADAESAFAEQATALAEAGADLLWIETLSSTEELRAAAAGAGRVGLPIVATMTFDTGGRTMMGLTPAAAVALSRELTPAPAAFGANCGVTPAQLVATVAALRLAAEPAAVLAAKGNCGIPRYEHGELHYDGTPEVMARYACLARDAGARIIGGCCGTTSVHLQAMASALRDLPRGPAPDRQAIEAALGPLPPAAEGPVGRTAGRRRAEAAARGK